MRRALKRKIAKWIEDNHYKILNKPYYNLCERIYYSIKGTDTEFTQKKHFNVFHKVLNLHKPETYNEKINWLMLNDRTDLHTQCADKLAVREFVKSEIGEKYLIPLISTYKKIEDLNINELPDYPFVIKGNHDSGSYHIIKNKKEHDWDLIKKSLKKSLESNYYYFHREWQYKNIQPTLLVEKLLQQEDGTVPVDYKFQCAKGDVLFIQVIGGRESKQKMNFYDVDWNLLPFKFDKYPNSKSIKKPYNFIEMVSLAKKLSEKFIFARIDFYEVNNHIYFGEITFHPRIGLEKFTPKKWDLFYGEKIKLPIT